MEWKKKIMDAKTHRELKSSNVSVWGHWEPFLEKTRASVHVSTDKPVYRPGEKVFVRAVVIGIDGDVDKYRSLVCSTTWSLQVISPKGDIVEGSDAIKLQNGVATFQWLVSKDLSGGDYSVKVKSDGGSNIPSGIRKINVRTYRNPKLRVKIEFLDSGYGPGDAVTAKISVTRSVGGVPPEGTEVSVTASIDGISLFSQPMITPLETSGECLVSFSLPEYMREGIGSLNAVVVDGGDVESGAKTIPIVLQSLDIELFPESGPLVEGVPNRVYFEALTPTKEPVDLQAELWEVGASKQSLLMPAVTSVHEGRGSFSFTPRPKFSYELRVKKPAGIQKSIPLPSAESELRVEGQKLGPLVSLSLLHEGGYVGKEEEKGMEGAILVNVASNGDRAVKVGLFWKEKLLDSVEVSLKQQEPQEVRLKLDSIHRTGAVLRVTVSTADESSVPIAERLVFHRPARTLQVAVLPGENSRVEAAALKQEGEEEATTVLSYPGANQSLKVRVTDSGGAIMPNAVVSLVVTDKSTLGLVEDRKKAPNLPEMVFLEQEVDRLEDPGSFLGGSSQCLTNVDLLLGTQGWRRFLYRNPLKSLEAEGSADVIQLRGKEREEGKKGEKWGKEERLERIERAMGLALKGAWQWPMDGLRMKYFARSAILKGGAEMMARGGGGEMMVMMPMALPGNANAAEMNVNENFAMAAEGNLAEAEGFAMAADAAGVADEQEIQEDQKLDAPVEVFGGEGREEMGVEVGAKIAGDLVEGMDLRGEEEGRMGKMVEPDLAVQRESRMVLLPRRYRQDSAAAGIMYERLFRHKKKKKEGKEEEELRKDFTETVFWAGDLLTDKNGEAEVTFQLSDSITSFSAMADAHTIPPEFLTSPPVKAEFWKLPKVFSSSSSSASSFSFLFGSSAPLLISSQKPLSVDAVLPLELTQGDKIHLPITIRNNVAERVRLDVGCQLSRHLARRTYQTTSADKWEEYKHSNASDPEALQPLDLKDLGMGPVAAPGGRQRLLLPVEVLPFSRLPDEASRKVLQQEDSSVVSGAVEGVVRVEVRGDEVKGGEGSQKVSGLPSDFADAVERRVRIVPSGFPSQLSFGGVLRPNEKGAVAVGVLTLPLTTVAGSVVSSGGVVLHRSPVSQLSGALESLLQEPYGCFEQTSATVYPNIMAQLYFKKHSAEASVVQKSYALLKKGYEKLVTFETGQRSGGFDWFGQSPAHEALTAYALLEFTDMAKVYNVPQDLLERIKAWLMKRKDDPLKTFSMDPRNLDSFGGAPADVTLAYIVWALAGAGVTQGLEPQLAKLQEIATPVPSSRPHPDPYVVSLVASSLFLLDSSSSSALSLASYLSRSQSPNGSMAAATSITSSRGKSLAVEATAMAAMVWVQAEDGRKGGKAGGKNGRREEGGEEEDFEAPLVKAMEFLSSQCEGGSFGSSQATVMALKAIMAYEEHRASSPLLPGIAHLLLDDARVATVLFDANGTSALSFGRNFSAGLKPGVSHRLGLEMEGGFPMPYSIMVKYHDTLPSTSALCSLHLTTRLVKEELEEGELAEVEVELSNEKEKPLPMVVAIIGFPGGLEVRHEQLQEMVTRKLCAFYEVKGREVTLYWQNLAANEKIKLSLQASAAVPGIFVGPASRTYEYYANDFKHWVEPMKCVIKPHQVKVAGNQVSSIPQIGNV